METSQLLHPNKSPAVWQQQHEPPENHYGGELPQPPVARRGREPQSTRGAPGGPTAGLTQRAQKIIPQQLFILDSLR